MVEECFSFFEVKDIAFADVLDVRFQLLLENLLDNIWDNVDSEIGFDVGLLIEFNLTADVVLLEITILLVVNGVSENGGRTDVDVVDI